ncbi:MAG: extracellular solute-binding protein [Clostridia bacterium]|nr:extracellular solute-binding protein [Clostridia bacterium]MDY5555733.1 extracellular solute-binding protein [Blautia sp.]
MKRKNKFFSILYVVLCLAFFYLPILVTMFFSFNSSKSLTRFTGFSLRWYEELIKNGEVIQAVYVSVTIALIATVVSTVLGTMTAIGLSKSKKIIKEILLNVNSIPILNPEIVTAISLMLLFSSLGMRKGYLTMLLAHIAFCTPYVITSVYPKVRALDPNLANAAMDLGATPYQALTKVILPMIKEGIFAGALLAFTMSFDDFVISYFVSGNGVKNISIVVYNMTKRINPTINALSTIVIAVIILVLLIGRILPAIKKKSKKMNKTVRRVLSVALAAVVCVGMIKWGYVAKSGHVLKVYNAGEYIDMNLVEEFEKEYNCSVVYETFESNEMMYTKLSGGETYDVLIPSDYMIQRLIKEEYLQALDWKLIPNKKNLMDEVLNKSYDPGNRYSCPYFWGTVGILYDRTVVDEADLKEGWNILRNPKYKGNIYMYDSERDSFMIALKALGYSMNTTDEKEIEEAYQWLIDQRDTMDPIYAGDDVIDNMISGNRAMAVVYSGDASYIISENPNMEYYTPDQGTNLWYDAMVITKDCNEVELAHNFINFMISDQSALSNTEEIGYTSTVKSAFDNMVSGTYKGITSYIPDAENPENEIFAYQKPKVKQKYAELWTKVKAK